MLLVLLNKKGMVVALCASLLTLMMGGLIYLAFKNHAWDVLAVVTGNKLHPIYAVDTENKRVAFSFDAAWGATRTQPILDILAHHQIKTTFFLTNIWLNQYPQLAKEISDAGHEIGLHSVTHPRLTDLSTEQIIKELQDNAALVTELTGQQARLFRPPFGAYNNKVIQTIQDSNYLAIQWSVDSLDWKNLTAEQIYERVMKRIHPGAIVLFHNDGSYTVQALEPLIKDLKKEGYEIIAISELLYKEDYYIDNNGIQKLVGLSNKS